MFGPPVNREITSQDIAYAFERLANPDLGGAGYPNYYTEIVGFEEFGAGEADTITGIETPDDKTIVFTLEKPVGDFLYRLAMPARRPDPGRGREVLHGGRRLRPLRDLVGPVHDRGLRRARHHELRDDEADRGLRPRGAPLPRAQPELRPGDRLAGAAGELPRPVRVPHQLERRRLLREGRRGADRRHVCAARPARRSRSTPRTRSCTDNLKLNPDDTVFYISMNLALPPFDDIHVRKAANLVMDKTALIRAWGGPTVG